MKQVIAFLFMLCSFGIGSAQQLSKAPMPQLSQYVYCEIIANHLPTTGKPVLFDFGQKIDNIWAYNKLRDENGVKLKFNSGIEALNYMVSRDWEFVQAYVSGKDSDMLHYLLRIPVAQLTDEWRAAMLTPPGQETPDSQ